MGNKKHFIHFDQRAYKFIRHIAIKDIDDALVELITNCDDAYNRINKENRDIEID